MLSKSFLLKSSAIVLSALLVGATASQAMDDDLGSVRKARSHRTANPELVGYQINDVPTPYLGLEFNRSAHVDDESGSSKDEKKESIHTVYSHIHSGTQYAFATKIGADGKIEIQTHQIIGLKERPFNIGLAYPCQYYKKKPAPSFRSGIAFFCGLNQTF